MKKGRYYQPCAIRPHERVRHREADYRSDSYVGSGEDLEQAGVLKASMLPPNFSITWRPAQVEPLPGESVFLVPGHLQITRLSDGTFRAVLAVSREERAARQARRERQDAEWQADIKRSRADEAAQREAMFAQKELQSLPSSHEQFRKVYAAMLRRVLRSGVDSCNEFQCRDGYSISSETLADFYDALDDAIGVLVEGTSVFNKQRREAYICELRAKVAKGDDEFKPFMSRLLEGMQGTALEE